MINIATTAIAAILVFGVLIASHEFGHFAVAKLCGVHVYSFNLGMGPKLWKWRRKETEYTIRLFPIGGSVQMMGEDEEVDGEGSFNTKPVWQRILVIAAGSVLNFLTAIILYIIIFTVVGVFANINTIGELVPGGTAEAAGIQAGDQIISINNIIVDDWVDIVTTTNYQSQTGEPLELVLMRQGQEINLTVTPVFSAEHDRWLIGIHPSVVREGFFASVRLGVVHSYQFTVELIRVVFGMITGQVEPEVGGPVAIVTVIGQTASMGLQWLLQLTAALSINLAVINLLPLPALDGSRIVFLIIEGLRGKPVNRNKEAMIHFVGLILLFGLMILITYQDIARLLR